ncbi:hypothetical protein ACTHUR_18845, partial [Neisseria sp. P0021.S007]|uniref:hypothetical protein n=1 Tax=Neisseria sp. P0021.S007 TaxID=3436822 RepID=UPI003F81DB27
FSTEYLLFFCNKKPFTYPFQLLPTMALGTPYHSFLLGLQYTPALYKHYPFVLMMKLFIPKYVYSLVSLEKRFNTF